MTSPTRTSLAEAPLPELLHRAHRARFTGTLELALADGHHAIYLRDGYPVAVTHPAGPGARDRIGDLLVDNGVVAAATLAQVALQHPPLRYGRALVAAGLVTPAQLVSALRTQVRRRLHRLFAAESGVTWFTTVEHGEGMEAGESLRVHPRRAVYQGIRGTWGAERVAAAAAPLLDRKVQLTLDGDTLARYGLSAADAALAARLAERPWTIEELASSGGCDLVTACALVAVFHATEALHVTAAAPRQTQAPPSLTLSGRYLTPLPFPARHPTARPAAAASGARKPGTDELRAKILERADEVEVKNHFEVLDVAPGAGDDEIKAAYLAAVKRYHPDRITARGLHDVAAQAGAVFRRVCEAFAVLSDPARRAAYAASLAPGGPPADEQLARRALDAELAFRRGDLLLKQRSHAAAAAEFRRAVELNPDEGEHHALHAWARLLAGEVTHAEARAMLEAAALRAPRSARAHHYLGVVLRELGDIDGALRAFRTAVELDPRHAEAASELRVLAARKAREDSGLLDRLRRR